MEMKKILFYIHNGWVFGKIHNELIKALSPDVYCDILCWTIKSSKHEFDLISQKYDYFVSTPEGCFALFDKYGVPLEKCIGVVHQDWDVYSPLRKGVPKEHFDKLAGYGVIAPILKSISLTHGIGRVPDLLRIGVFQNNYPRNKTSTPKRIGYFAKSSRVDQGFDVKRGHLVESVAAKTSLTLVRNEGVHFLGVEKLYDGIDLVICPSLVEGNPYPMLEAFACGIPCLSTPVGIAGDYLRTGGGVLLPMGADDLVYSASYEIGKMLQNNNYYRQLAEESYEIGKSIDWSRIRESWINYLLNLPN